MKGAHCSCELANPAQVRQIVSQTGDLLRQMRFVAGRGAVAEMLARAPSGRHSWQAHRKEGKKQNG